VRFSYLAFFTDSSDASSRISGSDLTTLRNVISGLAGIARANIYQPANAQDLFNDDPGSPVFGFQLYFEELEQLESAVGPKGDLQAIADLKELPSLLGTKINQQAMLNRFFSVAEPHPLPRSACSYAVHYPGPATDMNAWNAHYNEHHPAIMGRFPGVREIEILTRIDWIDALPWPRVHHMQRNRSAFDSAAALTAALHSEIRLEMRADYARFPSYENGNFHYPFETEIIYFRDEQK
jgi:hypothetical protein